MLKKLFKYEWKAISRMLLVVHGFALLFAVISRIYIMLAGGFDKAYDSEIPAVVAIAAILTVTLIVAVASASCFTCFYIAYRFYKNVFTDQGYLTNTLPVTPNQIMLSKYCTAVLWLILDAISFSLCMMIMFMEDFTLFKDIADLARGLSSMNLLGWIVLADVILFVLFTIVEVYFSIAVGNLFQTHKVLGSIGVYVGLYIIQQVVGILVLTAFGNKLIELNQITVYADYEATLNQVLTPIFSLIFVLVALATVLLWFGCQKIMTKKLNLQ